MQTHLHRSTAMAGKMSVCGCLTSIREIAADSRDFFFISFLIKYLKTKFYNYNNNKSLRIGSGFLLVKD